MPAPDDFNVEDYYVAFEDTYYEGPWVAAPRVLKVFKVGQYLAEVLKSARRCLQVDAEIPALVATLAAVDYAAGFHAGRESRHTDYVRYIKDFLPASYGPLAERIYTDLRCGLVHNLVAINPWRPAESPLFLLVPDSPKHLSIEDDRIVWSTRTFIEHVYQAWIIFSHALIMQPDVHSIDRFNARFDRLDGAGALMAKLPS